MVPTFVMKHKANPIAVNTSKSNEVWYVDSGASNHMTSHEKWFLYLEKREKQGVFKTRDDTSHTIYMSEKFPSTTLGKKGNS